MGKPELTDDERFATTLSRMENHDALDGIIAEWTKTLGKYEAMEQLQGEGVPAGPVFDARDTNLNEHYWQRSFLERISYPEERKMGERVIIGRPWKMSKTPISVQGPAPSLGQHNRELLKGVLGYDDARCDALEDAGIIATTPTNHERPADVSMDELVRRGRLAYHDPEYRQKMGL